MKHIHEGDVIPFQPRKKEEKPKPVQPATCPKCGNRMQGGRDVATGKRLQICVNCLTTVEETYYPAQPDPPARGVKKVKIPLQMDPKYRDIGARTKIVKRRAEIHSTNTKGPRKYYTFRAFMTKENTQPPQKKPTMELLTALLNTLNEAADITALPDQIITEIRKNIRTGAKDLQQAWANALELVHKAYQVANVRRPAPDQKGAWKQYEELIKYGVHELYRTRGLDGKWRMTDSVIREQEGDELLDKNIGKRRFFVDIPGAGAAEVAGKSLDDIIEQISNKLRRHGAKLRVDERAKTHAVLSVWVNDIKRERITVKEVS